MTDEQRMKASQVKEFSTIHLAFRRELQERGKLPATPDTSPGGFFDPSTPYTDAERKSFEDAGCVSVQSSSGRNHKMVIQRLREDNHAKQDHIDELQNHADAVETKFVEIDYEHAMENQRLGEENQGLREINGKLEDRIVELEEYARHLEEVQAASNARIDELEDQNSQHSNEGSSAAADDPGLQLILKIDKFTMDGPGPRRPNEAGGRIRKSFNLHSLIGLKDFVLAFGDDGFMNQVLTHAQLPGIDRLHLRDALRITLEEQADNSVTHDPVFVSASSDSANPVTVTALLKLLFWDPRFFHVNSRALQPLVEKCIVNGSEIYAFSVLEGDLQIQPCWKPQIYLTGPSTKPFKKFIEVRPNDRASNKGSRDYVLWVKKKSSIVASLHAPISELVGNQTQVAVLKEANTVAIIDVADHE
jgi:hypothetical protein